MGKDLDQDSITREEFNNLVEVFRILRRWRDEMIDKGEDVQDQSSVGALQ